MKFLYNYVPQNIFVLKDVIKHLILSVFFLYLLLN